MKVNDVVITEGPGGAWRGKLRHKQIEFGEDGAAVLVVCLRNARPVEDWREVLTPEVEVLAYSVRLAASQAA